MKTLAKAAADKQWGYGIVIWFSLSVLAYVLMIPFRLLLPAGSPHSAWQLGAAILLAIILTVIAPVLLFRVCSHFVHLAESSPKQEHGLTDDTRDSAMGSEDAIRMKMATSSPNQTKEV